MLLELPAQVWSLSPGQSPHLRKALQTELFLGGDIFSHSASTLSPMCLPPQKAWAVSQEDHVSLIPSLPFNSYKDPSGLHTEEWHESQGLPGPVNGFFRL